MRKLSIFLILVLGSLSGCSGGGQAEKDLVSKKSEGTVFVPSTSGLRLLVDRPSAMVSAPLSALPGAPFFLCGYPNLPNVSMSNTSAMSSEERHLIATAIESAGNKIMSRSDYSDPVKNYLSRMINEAIFELENTDPEKGPSFYWGEIGSREGSVSVKAIGLYDPQNDAILIDPSAKLEGGKVSPLLLGSMILHEVQHRVTSLKNNRKSPSQDEAEGYEVQAVLAMNPGRAEDVLTGTLDPSTSKPMNDFEYAASIPNVVAREIQKDFLSLLKAINENIAKNNVLEARRLASNLDPRRKRPGFGLKKAAAVTK